MVWIVVEVVGGDDDARTHKKNSTESQSFLRPLIYSATTAALCSNDTARLHTDIKRYFQMLR